MTEEWLVAEGSPRVENRTRNRATSTGVSPASASQYFVRPGGRCLAWAGLFVGFSIAWLVLAGQPGADVPGWSTVLVVAWTAVPAIVLCGFYLTSRLSVDDGQIELSFFGGLRRHSLPRAGARMTRVWVWRSTNRVGATGTMYRYEVRRPDESAPIKCVNDLWSGAALERFAKAVSLPLSQERPVWPVRIRLVITYFAGPLIYLFAPVGVAALLTNGTGH